MIRSDDIAGGNRRRPLGLMVVHSPLRDLLRQDLAMAVCLGASRVELLPRWSEMPDPKEISKCITDNHLQIWSVHGPWGGQSIRAQRVDLSDPDWRRQEESIDDVRRAADFAESLGAAVMVVHPGGLSAPDEMQKRKEVLAESLARLAGHLEGGRLRLGVENMPRGVYPGSHMSDLKEIMESLGTSRLGLVLDTGHANITGGVVAETIAAGNWLLSTHVHDNNGKSDTHLPPGQGTVDWAEWLKILDDTGYSGLVMLECVKHLRENSVDARSDLEPFLSLFFENR
ncbi:MAG: sugar phosphate isomerase/epimerase family protein [bacterium]